jgi:hypothetical protein
MAAMGAARVGKEAAREAGTGVAREVAREAGLDHLGEVATAAGTGVAARYHHPEEAARVVEKAAETGVATEAEAGRCCSTSSCPRPTRYQEGKQPGSWGCLARSIGDSCASTNPEGIDNPWGAGAGWGYHRRGGSSRGHPTRNHQESRVELAEMAGSVVAREVEKAVGKEAAKVVGKEAARAARAAGTVVETGAAADHHHPAEVAKEAATEAAVGRLHPGAAGMVVEMEAAKEAAAGHHHST